jgi:hypothetical protein
LKTTCESAKRFSEKIFNAFNIDSVQLTARSCQCINYANQNQQLLCGMACYNEKYLPFAYMQICLYDWPSYSFVVDTWYICILGKANYTLHRVNFTVTSLNVICVNNTRMSLISDTNYVTNMMRFLF